MNDNFLGRIADLVMKPGRLMENVGAAPRWWQAGLLVFVVVGAFTWLTSPISGPEQMEMMRDSKIMQMMPEDQWQQQYEESMNPAPLKRALSAGGAGLSSWAMVLVFGLILGFFAKMSGGQGAMKQSLGIVSWASIIPFVIASLIKLPLVLATESVYRVTLGLAALLPDRDPSTPLFQILMSYGDFLTWWGLIVLIIGFQRVYQMSRSAAAIAVLLPWALATAIPVGIGLLFM